jgi:hypothetical protein
VNKLPRKLKPTPEDAAAAIAALPRAQMKVANAQPALEPTPAPVVAPAPEPEPVPFAWTDAKRAKLIKTYVDTGDLLGAQQAVGATPSDFNAERTRNESFRAAVEASKKDARATLLMRAQSEALAGNDRLLQVFVKESDGDSDNLRHLTDDQLTQRLNGIFARIRARLEAEGWTPCQTCGALRKPA